MTRQKPDRRDLQQADRKDIQRADRRYLLQLLSDTLEHSDEACFSHRLHCIFIVRKGVPASTVAKWFNYSPSTITRWVRQFNELGPNGLIDSPKSGRPKNLNSEQLRTLKATIVQSPEQFGFSKSKWDGKCLQSHIETCYSISLGIRQCQRLIKQLMNDSQSKITENQALRI